MKASVIVCTYSLDMYDHFEECVESVLNQTHEDLEVILVVDGNYELFELISDAYGDVPAVTVHCNEENVGLSASRNEGLDYATGDIVAFIDDDAVADPRWIEELVSVYERSDAIAAGGKMVPEWIAGEPEFLPEEYYWLVGVTHKGFAAPGEEVRNTFGSNISFERRVLEELGGFDPEMGLHGEANLQSEETELCIRMRARYGRGVVYNPDAIVAHKVFEFRTRKRWLIGRAFWHGYSKRAMSLVGDRPLQAEESAFLTELLTEFLPERIGGLLAEPSRVKAKQLAMLCLLTAVVGAGYAYGAVRL